MKCALALAVGALGFELGSLACAALNPSLEVSQFAHKAWTTKDDSLKSGVRAIAQTSDGYLWLGTEFGLVRFDGVRFVPWAPPPGQSLPSTNIRSLVAARDGALWIGTLEGLASWKNGQLKLYPELNHQSVLTLLEDRQGTVWAGTFQVPRAKLCAIHGGVSQCYGQDGSLGQWVWSLFEDRDGHIWAGAETGLWRWKPGPPKRYLMPHPIETPQSVVESDHRQSLLAIGETLWQLSDEKITPYPIALPPGRVTPVNLFRDRDGGLWVGTLQCGLLHVHQGRTSVFAPADGLSGARVLTFFEDREGSLWVGTADGLDRFRESSVFSISARQGLSDPSVQSVLVAHDNSVWLSTLDGLNRWKDGRVTIFWPSAGADDKARLKLPSQTPYPFYSTSPEPAVTQVNDPGMPDNTVGSLYEDPRGRIWVSTPKGITRFENGRFTVVKVLPGGWVNAITGDSHGGIWISYQDLGLLHWADGKLLQTVPWSTFGGNVVASSVIVEPGQGGLWVGFFQGGLVHFKDGRIMASYGKKDGLGEGRVMGLLLDRDGAVWAATEGGLSHLKDGHIDTLTSSNGLPCNTVHWAMEVDASFWVYTACGLLSIPRTEMEAWTADPARKVQFSTLDRSDGLRSRALLGGYTPRVSHSPDGRLWIADLQSVSVVEPHHLALNNVVPPVHIEQLIADARTYHPAGELRLPPRLRDVTIDYTALSFAVPEKIRFRYRLEGQDPGWREVINERRVQYSNLAPGPYLFQVIACNNSGVWNLQGDTLEFSIAPAYYQTSWFRALCALLLMALVWAIYRFRVRQLRHEFALVLEARVAERTSIARELHDTLLQSFHGLMLRFQMVSQLLPDRPIEAKEQLDRSIDRAAQAITEGRDAVQGLRASAVQTNDLAQAISTLGEELAADPRNHQASPAFRVTIEGESRDLHPILRDEIYRIAAEALRNAFHHASASRIEVEIRYDPQQFRLRIRDDGRGMDQTVISDHGRSGHFGLPGMRERAKLMGGKLDIWSEIEGGTEVELRLNGGAAYASTEKRSWLSELMARK